MFKKTDRTAIALFGWLTLAAGPPALAQMPGGPAKKPPGQAPKQTPRPAPKSEQDRLREEARDVLGPAKRKTPVAEAGNTSWHIVIAAFKGDDRNDAAAHGLRQVQGEGGLPGAYLEQRGEMLVIAYGKYTGPMDKRAVADLDRIKKIEVVVGGSPQRPFEACFLSPPADIPGTVPEFDLRNARKLTGDWVLYTLQVGVYSREDGKEATAADMAEFRKAAEQAVVQLRREGDPAYYYHGPRRSMVTVGLFGMDDFDPQAPGVESPVLRKLRQKYPHNLLNGMGVRRTIKITDPKTGAQVKREKIESSALVNVPKD
ncbi:MAG: hypothetical protein WD749_05425 [Phycisphaerales bacterium]